MSRAFFDKIRMPKGWTYLGKRDLDASLGAVVKVSPELILRIFEMTGSGKGGIVEKRYMPERREFKYKCLIQNKTPDEINEFITKTFC